MGVTRCLTSEGLYFRESEREYVTMVKVLWVRSVLLSSESDKRRMKRELSNNRINKRDHSEDILIQRIFYTIQLNLILILVLPYYRAY